MFANYDMKTPLKGMVWSNDAEGTKKKTDSMGAQFKVFGYQEPNWHGEIDLSKCVIDAEPVIMVTRRFVKDGMTEAYKSAYNKCREHYKMTLVGQVGMITNQDMENPNVWYDF
jgi:hypothetical protein